MDKETIEGKVSGRVRVTYMEGDAQDVVMAAWLKLDDGTRRRIHCYGTGNFSRLPREDERWAFTGRQWEATFIAGEMHRMDVGG